MADLHNYTAIKPYGTSGTNYLEGLNIDNTLYKIHDPLLDEVLTYLNADITELATRVSGKMDSRDVIAASGTIAEGSTAFVESGAIYSALALKTNDSDLANVAKSGNYSDLRDTPDLSGYIDKDVNDLTYYYTKTQTDTEITNAVNSAVNGVKQFNYQVVDTLPTAGATEMYKIYLTPLSSADGTDNVYEEYMCIDHGSEANPQYTWELIGTTRPSLSGYVTSEGLTAALTNYVTTQGLTTELANYVTAAGLTTTLNGYQEKLTFDTTPTSGSTAPVTSGGIYTALNGKADDSAVVKTVNGVAPTNGNITINGATASVIQQVSLSQDNSSNYYTWNVSGATLSFLSNVQGQA